MLSKPLYPLGINELQNVFIHTDIVIENVTPTHTTPTQVQKKRTTKIKEQQPMVLDFYNFYRKPICLNKYKLPELKIIAKFNKLPLAGSKSCLIEKIENFFFKNKCVSQIQNTYKSYIVKKCYELRGDARHNRSICVNSSDFYTLEPIEEIHPMFFLSYKDEKNFIFGFNICSLVHLIINTNNIKAKNPYNRENFGPAVLDKIQSMCKLIRIIFNGVDELTELPQCLLKESNKISRFRQFHHSRALNHRHAPVNTTVVSLTEQDIYMLYVERTVQNLLTFDDFIIRYRKNVESRNKPVDTRINELFMEIDQLGNYTQASWFMNLEKREYMRLYRSLYDIWMYKAQLPFDMKKRICILEDPFTNALGHGNTVFMNDISFDRIRLGCLNVIENMVYTGIDVEHRKLGCLHALTALTMASRPARESMPWLYESIIF